MVTYYLIIIGIISVGIGIILDKWREIRELTKMKSNNELAMEITKYRDFGNYKNNLIRKIIGSVLVVVGTVLITYGSLT